MYDFVFRSVAIALCLSVGWSKSASATEELPALARAAGEAFEPVSDIHVASAKSALLRDAAGVDVRLGQGAFGDRWRKYLLWKNLRAELAEDRPKLATLSDVYDRLTSGEAGLEEPVLQALARSLRRYIDVALLASSFSPQGQRDYYTQEMERLARQFEKLPEGLSYQASFEVERRMDFIAGLGRSTELIIAFRREFGAPNLYLEATSPFLNQLAQRPIREPTDIRECIQGTRIRGAGCTDAQLSLCTVPSIGSARVLFVLTGTIQASTLGLNGPVAIRSSSQTQFQSSKHVDFDYDSFTVYPADAAATTKSQTLSVTKTGGDFGRRLVERIGRKRVAEQKGSAEVQSAEMAEGKISARFDEDLLERIQDARNRMETSVIRPAQRRHATPRAVNLATTSAELAAQLVLADRGQFAAGGPPPSAATSGDLKIRLHETSLQHLAGVFLAGATIEKSSLDSPVTVDRKLPDAVRKALIEAPARSDNAATFRPWKMTLRKVRPLSVRLDDNLLAATLHLSMLDVGDRVFRGWDLTFRFEPENIGGKWVLVRKGQVDPLPVGFDPESGLALRGQPLTERGAMIDKIEESLGESLDRIEVDRITLDQPTGAVRGLRTTHLQLEAGWATLAWLAFSGVTRPVAITPDPSPNSRRATPRRSASEAASTPLPAGAEPGGYFRYGLALSLEGLRSLLAPILVVLSKSAG